MPPNHGFNRTHKLHGGKAGQARWRLRSTQRLGLKESNAIKYLAALFFLIAISGTALATEPRAGDLTGFWKQNCDEPYGLQIMPYGENLYTVEFCGPGGGGCTQEPRGHLATPIYDDPQYEVLSENQVRIFYSDTYAPVYVRCTMETHPTLAYSAASEAEARKGLALGILIHLAYAILGIAVYVAVRNRLPPLSVRRGLLVRTGMLALIFAPGPFWSFPFVAPSFALLALVVQVGFALPTGFWLFAGAQVALSAAAILISWIALLLAILLVRAIYWRREHGGGAG